MALVMSYGGILVDGFLAYMCICIASRCGKQQNLMNLPSRRSPVSALLMFMLWIAFHVSNFLLFDIGVFPMMMLSCLCLFFDTTRSRPKENKKPSPRLSISYRVLIISYFVVQILIPLRFLLHSKSSGRHVNWTGHGEMFSWRMMLTSKRCEGYLRVVRDNHIHVLHDPEDFGLSHTQWWRMISDVEHVRQMAHYLRNQNDDVSSVRAFISCSLNGIPSQPFLNSDVDFSVLNTDEIYSHVLDQKFFL